MILVLAAASVRADDLHLDVMQDELLGGEYYPNNSNSTWYIKFSARVEGEEIVSACEIWTAQQGYLAEVTALKIPYRNKYSLGVDHMQTRVIRAAKTTAQLLKKSWLLPATVDDIAEAYWNMADSLVKKTADMGKNQVRFAVMYHSVIIRAALRITNDAKYTKDICQVSPDYEYAESSSLFICAQDLPQLKHSPQPHKRQQRFIQHSDPGDGDGSGGCVLEGCDDYSGLLFGDVSGGSGMEDCGDCSGLPYCGLCGSDHGCCGNYKGCCQFATCLCYLHDRACTCCDHWWCLWECECDHDCDCCRC